MSNATNNVVDEIVLGLKEHDDSGVVEDSRLEGLHVYDNHTNQVEVEKNGYDQSDTLNAVSAPTCEVEASPFPTVYPSWEAFEMALKSYSQSTFQLYAVRTTTSVKRRNYRISQLPNHGEVVENDRLLIPEALVCYSKTLKCTHGWKDRQRGTGKRPVTMVRSTGCPVKMCVTVQHISESSAEIREDETSAWQVVVTKHTRTHNHPLSKALYMLYMENRRICDPELLAIASEQTRTTLKPNLHSTTEQLYAVDEENEGKVESSEELGDQEDSDITLNNGTIMTMAIKMPQKWFPNWESFHTALDQYAVSTNQQFSIRSSTSVSSKNQKLLELSIRTVENLAFIPESLKWYSKLFICQHGWKRNSHSRMQSTTTTDAGDSWTDSIPNTGENMTCPAMLLVRLQRVGEEEWRVVVNKQRLGHTHSLIRTSSTSITPRTTVSTYQDPTNILMEVDDVEDEPTDNLATTPSLSHINESCLHDDPMKPTVFKHSGTTNEAVVRVPKISSVFETWESFHERLEEYSKRTYQSYRIRTTSSVSARNFKINELKETHTESMYDSPLIPERFKWYSKTLTCTHGWKDRRRGSGKRTMHILRSTECPVKICATLQYIASGSAQGIADYLGNSTCGWRIVVTKHIVDHNHNLSKELYQYYCDNRRIYDPDLLMIDRSHVSLPSHTIAELSAEDVLGVTSEQGTSATQPPDAIGPITEHSMIAFPLQPHQSTPSSTSASNMAFVAYSSTLPGPNDTSSETSVNNTTLNTIFETGTTTDQSGQSYQQYLQSNNVFTTAAITQWSIPDHPWDMTNGSISSQTPAMAMTAVIPDPQLSQGHTSDEILTILSKRRHGALGGDETMDENNGDDAASNDHIWSEVHQVQVVRVVGENGQYVWHAPRIKRRHESWTALHEYLARYGAATHQLYKVRTTTSTASRNSKLTKQLGAEPRDLNDTSLIPLEHEWYSKTFVCTHGWKERRRGKGHRVAHTIRSTSCPVKICATLQREQAGIWEVVVTKQTVLHNHEISKELFQSYSENRQIKDPECEAKAKKMWEEGQPRRKIYEFLKEATQVSLLMKDVHNLVQRWQQASSSVEKRSDELRNSADR